MPTSFNYQIYSNKFVKHFNTINDFFNLTNKRENKPAKSINLTYSAKKFELSIIFTKSEIKHHGVNCFQKDRNSS